MGCSQTGQQHNTQSAQTRQLQWHRRRWFRHHGVRAMTYGARALADPFGRQHSSRQVQELLVKVEPPGVQLILRVFISTQVKKPIKFKSTKSRYHSLPSVLIKSPHTGHLYTSRKHLSGYKVELLVHDPRVNFVDKSVEANLPLVWSESGVSSQVFHDVEVRPHLISKTYGIRDRLNKVLTAKGKLDLTF